MLECFHRFSVPPSRCIRFGALTCLNERNYEVGREPWLTRFRLPIEVVPLVAFRISVGISPKATVRVEHDSSPFQRG